MKFDTRGMQAAGMSTAEINRAIAAGEQRAATTPRPIRINTARPQRTPPKRTSSR